MAAAAFFDLDRTLLRRSSALALAGSFRERGLISRRQLLQAAAWQLLFVARGASHEAVRRGAEDGLRILAGYRPEDLRELVAEAMEPVLRPLVYAEPLRLVERHRERGERVYVVSATLQEIVEAIAEDLGFDGALGTVCEVRDGRYTGRALRALHAEAKADCVRAVAESEGFDLVGVHRVLRQPHRPSLPRSRRASGRGQSRSRAAADCARSRLAGARVQRTRLPACPSAYPSRVRRGRRSGRRGHRRHEVTWTLTRAWAGCARSASGRPTRRSCGRTSTGPSAAGSRGTATRGSPGSRGSRATTRRPSRRCSRRRTASSAGTAEARSATSCSGAWCARSSSVRPRMRGSSSASGRSPPGCSATTCAGSPRAGSSAC